MQYERVWLRQGDLTAKAARMFELTLFNAILLIGAGLAAGFINVTAGGGSMLTLPAMIFMGIPGPIANGTNRVGILFQNISAVTAFYRKGLSDFKLSFTLALCTLPGAIIGAMSAARLKGEHFNLILAGVMLIVMALTLFGNKPQAQGQGQEQGGVETVIRGDISRRRLIWGHICMCFVGLWGGFIQIGAGFILIPILNRVMGLDLLRTNMHKVAIVLVYTVAALAVFANQLEMEWLAGFFIALGMMVGAWIGARLQIKQGTGYIKWIINIVLLVFVVKLVWGYL